MQKEQGVTLASLVITIIVMLIIAGVGINAGTSTIRENKKVAFVNELKIVQAEVNIISEKIKLGNTSYDAIGQSLTGIESTTLAEWQITCLKGKTTEEVQKFKYYTVADLVKMDIKNVNQEVLINMETREVISVNGIEEEGKMCYQLDDFPGEGYNVK